MDPSVEVTASSLEALSMQYQAIAHNLANAATAGYKRRCTSFLQSLQAGLSATGGEPSTLGGTVTGKIWTDFSQGAVTRTDRPLDLALSGKGFFVLETPQGALYTRSGVFTTNPDGQIVDSSGRMVAGEAGPIVVPPTVGGDQVRVAGDATVTANGRSLGKLRIVQFDDDSVLEPVGGNCFRAPEAATPAPATGASVLQGCQESPNTNVVEELVSLITVTRLYEANLKVVQTQDERLRSLMQVAMA